MKKIMDLFYDTRLLISVTVLVIGLIVLIFFFRNKGIKEASKKTILSLQTIKTVLYIIFIVLVAVQFIRPYILDLYTYNKIAEVEIEGMTVEYCEQVNEETGEKNLQYCIDGKCKALDTTLMSKDFTWIVFVDEKTQFTVYQDSNVISPFYTFEYDGDRVALYIFNYFDQLIATKKDDPLIYDYEVRANEFIPRHENE